MCSPSLECCSHRVSTYHVARSIMLWLLVSRRFRLFILCLIAPLVINHLTPELITASIIPWGYHLVGCLFFFHSLQPVPSLARLGNTSLPNCHPGFQSTLRVSSLG